MSYPRASRAVIAPASTQPLIGRDPELRVLIEALDVLPERGSALVLRGEAGIGKTVLLKAARELAEERRAQVLYTAGVASESDLPFAGLHRLLRPVLNAADELPPAHRSALLAALGVDEDPASDPFLVAAATLELLCGQATDRPVLAMVDDLHWLDAPSRDAIAFVGRRIESDPVVLLMALRDGYDDEIGELGLTEQVLRPLADAEASAVLDARTRGVDVTVRRRLLTEAAGNPLALMELPTCAGEWPAEGEAVPLNARLERAFSARLREMPEETGALLLIAAADESLKVSEMLAVGEVLLGRPSGLSLMQPAIEARLVTLVGSELIFRHPLVRSAIYQAAEVSQRNATHAALAQVFADQPDRRAWHRAAAALGPDESVAQDIEDMAERARRRGAALQASAGLARAARLSTDPEARVRRLLAAAEQAFEGGRVDRVRDLVVRARREILSERDRARADWLMEIFDDGSGPGQGDVSRVQYLVRVAREAAAADDRELAVALLLAAAYRTWWGASPLEVGRQLAAAISDLPGPSVDAGQVAAMAIADPLGHAAQVQELIQAAVGAGPMEPRTVQLLGQAAHCIFDSETALGMHVLASERLREQGRLALLAQTLALTGVDSVLVGDWGVATTAAGEAIRLAAETDQPIWLASAHGTMAAATGIRGNFEAAEKLVADGISILDAAGTQAVLCWLQICRGFVDLSAGRYDEAHGKLARIFDPDDPTHHRYDQFMAVGLYADAAVGCGERDRARKVVASLTELAGSRSPIGMRMGCLYAEPLLAPDEEAEGKFLSALGAPWSARPFERARLQLAYGMWLRRRRRPADSREPLRLARDRFDAMGAPTWGDRARQELRATGESSRKRQPESWDQLSAQELQIATLAAAGLSNREIGRQLYISHRTVANHLYRIFPKLGVAARGQLATKLPV